MEEWCTQDGERIPAQARAPGTELVYVGRTGGTQYGHTGGGANQLCMPPDPQPVVQQL